MWSFITVACLGFQCATNYGSFATQDQCIDAMTSQSPDGTGYVIPLREMEGHYIGIPPFALTHTRGCGQYAATASLIRETEQVALQDHEGPATPSAPTLEI